MQIDVTKDINASVEKVFAVLSDIENTTQYLSAITKIEMLSSQKQGVGTRWRETRMMFGKEATEEMEITAMEKDKFYKVEADSSGTHYTTIFNFVGTSPTSTQVTMSFIAEPRGIAARLLSPFAVILKGTMVKEMTRDLMELKSRIEEMV